MRRSTLVAVAAVLFAAPACGGAVAPAPEDPDPVVETGTVTVESAIRVDAVDDQLHVRIHVANGTASPAYVYTEALRYVLDDGARSLTLIMHEVPTPPTGSSADCHVHIPGLALAPAHEAIDLEVRLPSVDRRFVGGQWVARPLASARAIAVELGWSDRRIALDRSQQSLCRFDAETALMSLERGVSVGRFAF